MLLHLLGSCFVPRRLAFSAAMSTTLREAAFQAEVVQALSVPGVDSRVDRGSRSNIDETAVWLRGPWRPEQAMAHGRRWVPMACGSTLWSPE
jgi:hypothetical protein